MTQNTDVIEMVEKFGMTPSEATDYYAVEIKGYTQEKWAEKRGLDGHQSVGRNVREARKKLKDPRNLIDTVIVDPDDVIEALRFNGKPEGAKNQRSAVLRITPPFESESEASIFYEESGNYYAPDMNPKPIHIPPRVFIGENTVSQPIRADERARAKDELDDPTEEDIEEFVDTAFEVWEEDIRSSLPEKTDINDSKQQHGTEHIVSIKYK